VRGVLRGVRVRSVFMCRAVRGLEGVNLFLGIEREINQIRSSAAHAKAQRAIQSQEKAGD